MDPSLNGIEQGWYSHKF